MRRRRIRKKVKVSTLTLNSEDSTVPWIEATENLCLKKTENWFSRPIIA